MSLLLPFKLDLQAAEAELSSFEAWFSTVGFVNEKIVVDEIKSRPHMSILIGTIGNVVVPDLYKWELGLGGLYRTDFVVGNNNLRRFLLVEFEGANEFSLFGKKGTAQYRNWSPELEHGFGQTVDWASYHSYHKTDATLESNFGGPIKSANYLVICGRDKGIVGPLEHQRLTYRREHVRVEGIQAQVLTYDEMLVSLKQTLEMFKTV
ncbi:Shedu anti-phage system protein SduA domain-containing protein [Asticcacaulis benevestitus]|nr:Shedu anti-phage system protein SduA domain-containing protein [Asticcacaulis benevestitus]